MSPITAVLDACVLYPAPLRDLLMHLALAGLFRAKWTAAIHDEWIRSVLANRPDLNLKQLERTRDLMNRHAGDCLVSGYEDLIPTLKLPDADDRHVLAAAIRADARTIVTYNLHDFPADSLAAYEIEALHPDDFVAEILESAPLEGCRAAQRQRESLKSPPLSIDQFLATLERQGLAKSVAILRRQVGSL